MGKRQTTRKRHSRRNKMRRTRRMSGGSCGCSGAVNMKGGSASYSASSVPSSSHYPLNNYTNDPTSSMISSRNLPNMVGGKRRRKKCSKCGKMTGGSSFDGVSSFGTTSGAWNLLHSLGGKVNPAVYDQPVVKSTNTLV